VKKFRKKGGGWRKSNKGNGLANEGGKVELNRGVLNQERVGCCLHGKGGQSNMNSGGKERGKGEENGNAKRTVTCQEAHWSVQAYRAHN